MVGYIGNMFDEFTKHITDTAPASAAEYLFADVKVEPLLMDKDDELHTIIAKVLFEFRSSRPDIYSNIEPFFTHLYNPTTGHCRKMTQMIKYINGADKDNLVLSAEIHTLLSGMWNHNLMFTLNLRAT